MSTSVQVSSRPSLTRCAYCHAPLDGADLQTACPRCDTRLHAECVVRRRCPTLGCQHEFREAIDPPSPPSGTWVVLRWLVGVVLPLLCFGFNEVLRPTTILGGDRVLDWSLAIYLPEAQRPLYPLLAWAIAAFAAAERGRRGPWIRTGLLGGVALSALFSAAYLPMLPAALLGILLLGLGLLGFAPYFVLVAYLGACVRHEGGADAAKGPAPGARLAPAVWLVWAVGALAIAWTVARTQPVSPLPNW